MHRSIMLRAAAPLACLVLAACGEAANPLAPPAAASPTPSGSSQPLAVTCTATLASAAVTCGAPTSAPRGDVIVGGQGTFVKLASANVQVYADTFAFDVTVQNLLPQPMGTYDTELHPTGTGIRVFFAGDPVAVNGTVTVANPDDYWVFTTSYQPYFQYNTVLRPQETSDPRRWKLQFTPGTTSFTFTVYVSAQVPYVSGYIDGLPRVVVLNPGESVTVPGTVRTFVGTPAADQDFGLTSTYPTVAAASGRTLTGGTVGVTPVSAQSGDRPGASTPWVAVCPTTTVADGASIVSSISFTDCDTPIDPTDSLPGSLRRGDLYRVTLTAGQTLTVTQDGLESLDTWLLLADASGNVVAMNDDDPTGALGHGSRMEFTAPADGVYLIEATTYYADDGGAYILGVSIN